MEITFIWSWLSFWLGVGSAVVVLFLALVWIAVAQQQKQKRNAAKGWSDFEAMAKQWGSTKK